MLKKIHIDKNISIYFSNSSIEHFKKYIKNNFEHAVRISIRKSGCSGLVYFIDFTDLDLLNHTIIFEQGVKFLVDNKYLEYLNGLHINYTKQSIGLSSIVFSNANETARCGCGKSFTFDEKSVN
jgi:iron-sulfur cluster assembly protein